MNILHLNFQKNRIKFFIVTYCTFKLDTKITKKLKILINTIFILNDLSICVVVVYNNSAFEALKCYIQVLHIRYRFYLSYIAENLSSVCGLAGYFITAFSQ